MAPGQPRSSRPYDSSGRRARAALTKRQVVEAATDLFVAHGYGGTTVADVAHKTNVSQPTIYAAFGSKAGLLRRCIEVAFVGDDQELTLADRPLAQWVYETDDPQELLCRYAVMMATVAKRSAPVYDVLVRAADAEPELAQLLAQFEAQRLKAASMVADAVQARGGLAEGVSVEDARDTVWILNAPELYATVVRKRRWSQRRYETWSRTALVRLLTEPPVPAGERPGA